MPGDDITAGIDEGIDQVTDAGTGAAVSLPLDPDESVSRWIGDIITAGLAAYSLPILVYDSEVPTLKPGDITGQNSRFPAVLFLLHASNDRLGASARRMSVWSEYKVLVIDQSLSFAAQSAVKNIVDKALITAAQGYTADRLHFVSRAYRRTALRYSSRDEITGRRYNYQGGIYRLMHFEMPSA